MSARCDKHTHTHIHIYKCIYIAAAHLPPPRLKAYNAVVSCLHALYAHSHWWRGRGASKPSRLRDNLQEAVALSVIKLTPLFPNLSPLHHPHLAGPPGMF